MGTLLAVVYGFGGLFCILYVLSFLWEVLRKKRSFSDVIVTEKVLVILAFMLVFTPWYWYSEMLTDRIPEGDYRVDVAVSLPGVESVWLMPGDIYISSYTEESEGHYNVGAVEMSSTESTFHRYIELQTIYWNEDGEVFADKLYDEVSPETDKEIYVYDEETGSEGYVVVNIGVITPESLGLTLADQWADFSLWSKIEPGLIIVCCLIGIWQYFVRKKKASGETTK